MIEVEYEASAPAIEEGIRTSGAWMLGQYRPLQIVATLLLMLLVGVGGTGLAFSIAVQLTGTPEAALPYIWIGALVAIAFFIALQNWPLRMLAKYSARSAYCTGPQVAQFDAKGMVIRNQHSSWQTDWTAVDNVKLGKKGIILAVAGLVFVVPRDALTDAESVAEQLSAWKQAA